MKFLNLRDLDNNVDICSNGAAFWLGNYFWGVINVNELSPELMLAYILEIYLVQW